jgi:hypothetical protein
VVGEPVRLGLADQMNKAESDALNQIRESLRIDGYRDAELWSAGLMALTPEERAAFVNEEIARSGRGVANLVESAKQPLTRSSSELAAKLDELYATIQHLPFSDRMEILRALADVVGVK